MSRRRFAFSHHPLTHAVACGLLLTGSSATVLAQDSSKAATNAGNGNNCFMLNLLVNKARMLGRPSRPGNHRTCRMSRGHLLSAQGD